MTTAHFVKKARKGYKDDGIKKGESYYWWKFRNSGIYRSKVAPKPSQLTQSGFMSTILGIFETLEGLNALTSEWDDLRSARDEAVDALNTLADECEENKSNMPSSLQDGDIGQLLDDRAEGCRECASELEGIDLDRGDEDGQEDALVAAIDELCAVSYGGS